MLISVKPYSCITHIFIREIHGGVQDTFVLDDMRKDLTISLDEEYINALLEIAEKQNSTFSALIRDIISSYIQAVSNGLIPTFLDLTESREATAKTVSSSHNLSDTIARHAVLIEDLQRRVSLLEGRATPSPIHQQISQNIPDLIALTSPAPIPPSPGGIIDSDNPPMGNIAEEALVKVQRQPVAPVIDVADMYSTKITDDKEYTQTEAAVALGVSVSTMRKYIKDKKISARKVGRSWLIYGRDIRAFKAGVTG